MNALRVFRGGLDKFLRGFCLTLFILLIVDLTVQIVVRQVLNPGYGFWPDSFIPVLKTIGNFTGATEVTARILFIWLGLIGAAYVIGEKDDVAIDFLVRKLPAGMVKVVEILAHSIVAFFAIWIMLYGGARVSAAGWSDLVQLLPVTAGMTTIVVPIAGGLIALYSVMHIIETFGKTIEIQDPDDVDLDNLMEEGI